MVAAANLSAAPGQLVVRAAQAIRLAVVPPGLCLAELAALLQAGHRSPRRCVSVAQAAVEVVSQAAPVAWGVLGRWAVAAAAVGVAVQTAVPAGQVGVDMSVSIGGKEKACELHKL